MRDLDITSIGNECLHKLYIIVFALLIICSIPLQPFFYSGNSTIFAFPFSILAIGIACIITKKYKVDVDVSNRTFWYSCVGVMLLVAVAHVLLSLYYPYRYDSDLLAVRSEAEHLAYTFTLSEWNWKYIHAFPNNINVCIIFSWVYGIFGSWDAVEFFACLLSNMASLFSALTVRNIAKSNKSAFFALIVCEYLVSFCIWSFVPYSHSCGVLFPILILFIYTSNQKFWSKTVLLILITAIGAKVKITTAIPLIAIAFIECLNFFKERDWKKSFSVAVTCVVIFGSVSLFEKQLWSQIEYEEDKTQVCGTSYFVMLGQHTPSHGRVSGECCELGMTYNKSKQERDELFYSRAIQNFKHRGIAGNIKFYAYKLCMCFGDGSMDSYKENTHNPQMAKVLKFYSFPRQVLWYIILTFLMISPFVYKKKSAIVFYTSILGIVAYLMLLEAESRYVYIFAPVLVSLAIIGMVEYRRYILCKDRQ